MRPGARPRLPAGKKRTARPRNVRGARTGSGPDSPLADRADGHRQAAGPRPGAHRPKARSSMLPGPRAPLARSRPGTPTRTPTRTPQGRTPGQRPSRTPPRTTARRRAPTRTRTPTAPRTRTPTPARTPDASTDPARPPRTPPIRPAFHGRLAGRGHPLLRIRDRDSGQRRPPLSGGVRDRPILSGERRRPVRSARDLSPASLRCSPSDLLVRGVPPWSVRLLSAEVRRRAPRSRHLPTAPYGSRSRLRARSCRPRNTPDRASRTAAHRRPPRMSQGLAVTL